MRWAVPLSLLWLTMSAAAQETEVPQPPQTGVAGELVRSSSTTPQEKLAYAAASNEEMREAILSVTELLESARRESNVERLQCLTNRLTAIRALVQVSEAAEVTLAEAMAAGEAERADHEFRKIAVALTKTRQLLAEAERCLGDSGQRSGQTVMEVQGGIAGDPGHYSIGRNRPLKAIPVAMMAPPSATPHTPAQAWHADGIDTESSPLSTFSVDVDTGSYTFARAEIERGVRPRPEAVRPEEFTNYLDYDYPPPQGDDFDVHFDAAPSPWHRDAKIVRIGVQSREVERAQRKPAHFTFLVDTSCSMAPDNRLGMVRRSLQLLTGELDALDTVALVAYSGSAGVVLPPTPVADRGRILDGIDALEYGGSTAMGWGLEAAYRLADQTYEEGHLNHVIIASDGNANVGLTDPDALAQSIRSHALKGITLTTIGVGTGAYNDRMMELLADRGDGQYHYIDSPREARHLFVDELVATTQTIARDVKIQVAWNPEAVRSYRLVGYDNRRLADEDFDNDAVDAGEVGAGHSVTALYEVVLAEHAATAPWASVRLRWKPPGPDAPSRRRDWTLRGDRLAPSLAEADRRTQMAVAAASFAERLRDSEHIGGMELRTIENLASAAARPGHPEDRELADLVRAAGALPARLARIERYNDRARKANGRGLRVGGSMSPDIDPPVKRVFWQDEVGGF